MIKKFQTSSAIESVATRADGTIKLVIGTQELDPEQSAALFALKGRQGWFLFSDNELKESDVPKEQSPEFKGDKSPSHRLRAVLWQYWNLNTSHKPDFDTFYKGWTEKKIKEVKDTLPNS